jgi:hypothetical protein
VNRIFPQYLHHLWTGTSPNICTICEQDIHLIFTPSVNSIFP